MARADEAHLVRDLDRRAAPARDTAPRASARSIARRRLDDRLERVRPLADRARELAQDPLDLLALGARDLRVPVVQLDDLERLDEERLAGVGRVVDDARDVARARSP